MPSNTKTAPTVAAPKRKAWAQFFGSTGSALAWRGRLSVGVGEAEDRPWDGATIWSVAVALGVAVA